jgi:hypothetical protein
MNRPRLATQEEIEAFSHVADLDATCVVYAMDTRKGTGFAVRRIAVEIDPLIPGPDWDIKLKSLFYRDLENILWGQSVPAYYFNVHTEEEEWNKVVETWGATRTSTAPEFRYKKVL